MKKNIIDEAEVFEINSGLNLEIVTIGPNKSKIVIVDNDVTITWAGGSTAFNKSWTDRLSYVYS
jgi:hypothetical protein